MCHNVTTYNDNSTINNTSMIVNKNNNMEVSLLVCRSANALSPLCTLSLCFFHQVHMKSDVLHIVQVKETK